MEKLKILVVDDESRMRKLVRDFLKKKGYEVIEAADGEEALDYFFEDKSSNILQDDVLARLLAFNNVILTSHQAFLTNEALDNIVETTFDNILKYANKEDVENTVWYDEETQKVVEGLRKNKDKG